MLTSYLYIFWSEYMIEKGRKVNASRCIQSMPTKPNAFDLDKRPRLPRAFPAWTSDKGIGPLSSGLFLSKWTITHGSFAAFPCQVFRNFQGMPYEFIWWVAYPCCRCTSPMMTPPAARRLNCCAKYSCGLMSCTSTGFHQLENHENVGKTMPFWPAMTGKGKIYTTYWNGGLGGDWGMVYEIVLPTLWYIMVYSDCWVRRLHQVSAGSFSKMLATALPRIRIVTVTKVFRNEVLAIWTYMDLYAVQSGSI